MKQKAGLTAWLMYVAVRTVFMVMHVFPIDWNLRTARILAGVWRRLMPRHWYRAVAHIEASIGRGLTREELHDLADRCLESVAMFAVEAVCLPRLIGRFTWPRYIRLDDFEEVLDLLIRERGVILVTAHYGPFELPGHLLATLGFNVAAVMRPLDNVYLNGFLVRARQTHGLVLLDKKGMSQRAEQMLAEGAALGLIGDQDAGRKGLFVDFFARPASTYKSIALLAMSARCPIVVGFARRMGNRAKYVLSAQRIIRPEEWDGQDDPLRWITQSYTSAIEDFVREEPAQYLWIHRRWKSQPKRARVQVPARSGP